MRRVSSRGSVVLVALSCVTVLGIAMVAFLAVSNQAMTLSNRGYAKTVSKNLAEMGFERALRSFNANTFSSWTLSGVTATRTISIASSNYGSSGITATVNVRVERYRDTRKSVPWNDRTVYAADDFVWYQGVWYLCTAAQATQPVTNASYWTAIPAWSSTTTYPIGTYATLSGTDVYCGIATTNLNRNPSSQPTFWSRCNVGAWDSARVYVVGDVVSSGGSFYRCILAQGPWNTSSWKAAPDLWSPHANYRIGNIALSGGSAYRCIADHINQAPPNATYWTAATAAAWNAATTYAVDDVVWSGGLPYRCISSHVGQTPPNTTYWLSAPAIYAEGVARLPQGGGTDIKTQLRALIAPAPLFPNALGASTDVVLATTSTPYATIDSYNSVLGTYNQTTAPFSAGSPNTGSSAVVAGGDTASTAVAIGNVRIRGYVAAPSSSSSPYTPLTSNSTNGIVTSTASGTPTTKIDLTRVSRSPFIPQFDIQSVTGAGALPNGTTVLDDNQTTLGTPGATTPTKYNITGTWDGGNLNSGIYLPDATDILTIAGPVILNVSGTVYTNSGRIVILPGASLEIYFSGQLWIGSSATSGIQNLTLDPKRCLLVGTSTANSAGSHYYWTTLNYSSVYYTFATVYMPNAYVRTWSNVYFHGAISASNIGFPNSGVVFRYDTSLRTAGAVGTFVDAPYLTTEVRELTDSTERITLP